MNRHEDNDPDTLLDRVLPDRDRADEPRLAEAFGEHERSRRRRQIWQRTPISVLLTLGGGRFILGSDINMR